MANILHTIAPMKKGDTIIHKCSKGVFTYKVVKTNETEAVNILVEHIPLEEEEIKDVDRLGRLA